MCHVSLRFPWLLTLGLGAALPALVAQSAVAQPRRPVFVGAKTCAECHDGPAMNHQATRWLQTGHARAYASLASPEARAIARISGVPIEPQKSPLCLGCHATGADAEDWEKDDTFSFRDGVQCEKCHGAGSEHVAFHLRTNPASTLKPRLETVTSSDCMKCHKEKPSHRNVLKPTSFDLGVALKTIAHPTPEDATPAHELPPDPPQSSGAAAKITGSAACAECHAGPEKGFQFSRWRLTRHADAYAVLASPAARDLAVKAGVEGNPQASTACLNCHATAYYQPTGGTLDRYSVLEGVGCEACHGAGEAHAAAAAAKQDLPAIKAALKPTSKAACLACHDNAHGKPFVYEAALKRIAHPTVAPPAEVVVRYKTPINPVLSPDGKELYVTCEASYSVCVIDTASRKKVAEIPVGGQPMDVVFSPEGHRVYVTNRLDDSLSVIDVASRKVVATVPVGDEPHGVRTDRSGKTLYVLNTSSDDISVIDAATFKEEKRLAASRSPWSLALSPDGSRFLVTNALSRFVKFREPSLSEATVLATDRKVVDNRVTVPAANLLQGVAWHPSGEYALITLLRTKNLVPMTRMMQGWTVTNGLGVVWADGRVDQVLLDEPGRSFPDPTAVAITPDGTLALVTSAGTDRVAVVDLARLRKLLETASPEDRAELIPNHLGKSAEFLVAHVPTGINPRGLTISADGRTAYVACALEDAITVIDVASRNAIDRIDLGGPREITRERKGERLFNSANIAFRRQLSCHTCHPDGHVDGLTYDIEADGIGLLPVDNRTLRGILDTGPFKWEGTNPSLARQCGPRLSVYFTRVQPFTKEELVAVDHYISTIPRPPNRYRPLGAELTPAQRRGKQMFERTRTADGREIPKDKRCITCHFPPLYTDRERHDIGFKMKLDTLSRFDVPHLNNIYDSAPYLHNGIADTLEEIWTRFNPNDQHGVTNDMTKDQLNDLIEYLKTL
jgi:YVTN family beta-propeller protein